MTNSDSGKTVKVKGAVLRNGEPVIEVTSVFLYRGAFSDYPNTFEIVEDYPYSVDVKSPADVFALQGKTWFEWSTPAKPLLPGTRLIFKIDSEYDFKDRSTYSEVSVSGKVYVRDQLKALIPVGTIDYSEGNSHWNPVLAYLQRHGTAEGVDVLFDNGG